MARKKIGHIELQWTCPNCSGINPGPEKHCRNCGAPQPLEVKFEQSGRQELIEDEEKLVSAQAGADVHCPYCGSRNSAEAEVCHKCGGNLAEGVKRQSGRVIGAFKPGTEGRIICPNCGTENFASSTFCVQCGGSLEAGEDELQTRDSDVTPVMGLSRARLLIIAAVAAVLILACGAYFFFSNRTRPTVGIVDDVSWERSVPVEAFLPVEYQDWKDEIPAEGEIGSCSEQMRSVQDEPAENSVEVCGTPYSVDTGSGYAEVVQDCTFEVYDTFCTYSIDEWTVVEVEKLMGSGFSPQWPEPALDAGQRIGEDWTENYKITFNSEGKTFVYTTSDFILYQLAQIGSEWILNINTFGQLVSIEME